MVDALYFQSENAGQGVAIPAIKTTIGQNNVYGLIYLIAGIRTYIAAVMNSTAAASKNHLVLFNGTGSGVKVRVWDIKVNPNITATVTGTSIVLSCARCSNTGTGGATETIRKTDTLDASLPAEITANSNRAGVTYTSNELASLTAVIEETTGTEARMTMFKADSVIAPLVLNEGEGLGIQQGTFAGVGAVNIFIYFTID